MDIRTFAKSVLLVLWLGTLGAAVCWAFLDSVPFDPEPITVMLGLISAGVTALLNRYENRLTEEEYSTSHALAYGYVNNFIEPVITHLLGKGEVPKLFIFLPKDLTELEPKSTERIMALIRQKFKSETLTLELHEGRVRDIMTLHKDPTDKIILDFPPPCLH